jgi:hypothetical protein
MTREGGRLHAVDLLTWITETVGIGGFLILTAGVIGGGLILATRRRQGG